MFQGEERKAMKCLCCESTFSMNNRSKNDLRRVYDHLHVLTKIHRDNITQQKTSIDVRRPQVIGEIGNRDKKLLHLLCSLHHLYLKS